MVFKKPVWFQIHPDLFWIEERELGNDHVPFVIRRGLVVQHVLSYRETLVLLDEISQLNHWVCALCIIYMHFLGIAQTL